MSTVGVHYDKRKNKTVFTTRDANGKILDRGSVSGEASSDKIQQVIRDIKGSR